MNTRLHPIRPVVFGLALLPCGVLAVPAPALPAGETRVVWSDRPEASITGVHMELAQPRPDAWTLEIA